jgi:hypothetical protein
VVLNEDSNSLLITYFTPAGGSAIVRKSDGTIQKLYDGDGRAGVQNNQSSFRGEWATVMFGNGNFLNGTYPVLINTTSGKMYPIPSSIFNQQDFQCFCGVAVTPDGVVFTKIVAGTGSQLASKLFQLTIPGVTGFPTIVSFTANPSAVIEGDPVTLSWVTAAASVAINQGVGTVPTSGSVTVTPTVSTPYTLTATNPGGITSSTVTVTVTPRAIVPMITDGGVVNAASFAPLLSPGTYASIFGVNLSDSTATAIAPYPSLLSGVMVLVNSAFVPVQYISPKQINFLIPYDAALGKANVQVLRNGIAGNIATITISATSPGVFTNGDLGIATDSNGRLITADNPLVLGTPNILWLTGLGRTTCLASR